MRKGHRQPRALCYQYTIMSPYATYINYRLALSYNILLHRYNYELTILAIEQASAPGTVATALISLVSLSPSLLCLSALY